MTKNGHIYHIFPPFSVGIEWHTCNLRCRVVIAIQLNRTLAFTLIYLRNDKSYDQSSSSCILYLITPLSSSNSTRSGTHNNGEDLEHWRCKRRAQRWKRRHYQWLRLWLRLASSTPCCKSQTPDISGRFFSSFFLIVFLCVEIWANRLRKNC